MLCRPTQPHDDARVLHFAIGVEQPRTHNANVIAQGVAHHVAQPVGLQRCRVIVQQQDQLAARLRHGKVVHA